MLVKNLGMCLSDRNLAFPASSLHWQQQYWLALTVLLMYMSLRSQASKNIGDPQCSPPATPQPRQPKLFLQFEENTGPSKETHSRSSINPQLKSHRVFHSHQLVQGFTASHQRNCAVWVQIFKFQYLEMVLKWINKIQKWNTNYCHSYKS